MDSNELIHNVLTKNLITMVIPTHNRHHYLRRAIQYYSNASFPLIIVDSTDIPYNGKFHDNIQYIHTKLSFPYKLFKVVQMVKTKYFVLCGDDDFITFLSLEECLLFLENNSQYTAAQGRGITFVTGDRKIRKIPYGAYAQSLDVNSNDVGDRMNQYMKMYMPFMYAVMRTIIIKDIFKLMSRNEIVEANLVEMGIALSLVIYGKIKILPNFYCAREKIANSSGRTYKTLFDISRNIDNSAEYKRFQDMLSRMLVTSQKYTLSKARHYVRNALSIYLNDFYVSHKQSWSGKNRVLKIFRGIICDNKIKALLFCSIFELGDIDLFFDIIHEKGYPFSWDQRASKEWWYILQFIMSHKDFINKSM